MNEFQEGTLPSDAPDFFDKWKIFLNNKYQVNVRHLEEKGEDGWVWLSIKRIDKEAIHDWRELQEIKNKICGEEREGLELYPAESRLVDSSNQFHIFAMPTGERFPFGYKDRLVVDASKGGFQKSGQREFANKPVDCISVEEAELRAKAFVNEGGKQ